jgi:hypothetical protein
LRRLLVPALEDHPCVTSEPVYDLLNSNTGKVR